MPNNFRDLTLNEISSKYQYVLWDTCAISECYFHKNKEDGSTEEKVDYVSNLIKFKNNLEKMILNGGNFYITPGVYNELFEVKPYNLKKSVKAHPMGRVDEFTKLWRAFRKDIKAHKRLASTFQESGKILDVNNLGIPYFQLFEQDYSFLKNQFNLSEVDFKILETAATLSKRTISSAIISNDTKLWDAYSLFMIREKKNYSWIGFFKRMGFDNFC